MAKRKAHVKRIWKSDNDGNPIESMWVDVLRIDKLPVNFQSTDTGIQGQLISFKFHWNDDASNPDEGTADTTNPQLEDANPGRETRRLYIKNPSSPDDDSQTNTLWITDKTKIAMPQGASSGASGQTVKFVFGNANKYSVKSADPPYDESNIATTRKTTVIKVTSNDLNGFEMKADNTSDGIIRSKIVDWDIYKKALQDGTKDDSVHLDVEVTDSFKIAFGSDAAKGYQNQIVKYVLSQNKELEPDNDSTLTNSEGKPVFEAGDPDAKDSNGDPSVIRTDPLQIIVNVSPAAQDFVLYGSTQDGNTNKGESWVYTSKDGFTWTKQTTLPDIFHGISFGFTAIEGMAYGVGQWLIVDAGGNVWVSTDLFKTWKKVFTGLPPTNPGSLSGVRTPSPIVAWGHPKNVNKDDPDASKNGYFVYGDNQGKIWTSKDKGVTWVSSNQDLGGGGSMIRSVNYAGGQFIVVVNDFNQPDPNGYGGFVSTIRTLISTDGTTWVGSQVFADISNLTVTGDALGGDIGYVSNHIIYGVAYDTSKKTYGFTSWFTMTISDGGESSFLAEGTADSSTGEILWAQIAGPYGDWQTINTAQGDINYFYVGQPAMGGGKFLAPYTKFKSGNSPTSAATGEWGVFTSLSGTKKALDPGKSLDFFTCFTGQPSACAFSPVGADKEKGYVGTFVVIEQFGKNDHFTAMGYFFKIWWSKDADTVVDTGNSPYGIETTGVHTFVRGLVLGPTPKKDPTQ